MAGPAYVKGDFWRICEECGFKMRASQTLKRWDGLIVCRDDWEERQPQDFVRGRIDRQNVPNPRPEPVNGTIGPLTTTIAASASPGATTLNVASSVRFVMGDMIGILLDGGSEHKTTLVGVPDGVTIMITSALPISVSVGNSVVNYSAVSVPSL